MTGPATFRLWIAFGTEAHAATLEASDTPWADVTDYVRSAQFSTSTRSSRFDRFAAGQAAFVLDNSTRLFDPLYTSGTYYGDFKRHTPVRVTAEHSSTRYTVWRGWCREFRPDYFGRFDSVTTVHAVDALGLLARYELDKATPATGYGDTAVDRFDTVTGLVGFPAAMTDTTASGTTGPFAATEFGENAFGHLANVVASDGGHMFADRDGVLTLVSRVAPAILTRMSTSQVTLDDTAEPKYAAIIVSGVGEGYRDIVRWSGVTGNVQEVDNSATDSAPVVYQQLNTTLLDDSAAASTAEFFADLYATETPAPLQVTVDIATSSSDLRTVLLLRRLRDRVTVVFDPPGGGADISADCFLDGIAHDVTPERWRATYQLSPAASFDALAGPPSTWLIIDDATRGKVGTGTVAY